MLRRISPVGGLHGEQYLSHGNVASFMKEYQREWGKTFLQGFLWGRS